MGAIRHSKLWEIILEDFLNQNAPSISRNPFEALRKLGGDELDRPEVGQVLGPLPKKKIHIRLQSSKHCAAGHLTRVEEEKAPLEERVSEFEEREETREAAGSLML
ncbi:hypothetical protein E5676_scaffold1737G00990 [Cucumis melo var. makuwa]|uniref:Uncharacterized protein n=1 Tax=Cucumis melo var. makuwa TaxID=1194695 RepID=A0A5D3CBR8_CUCMM|nr:hypothetical protein E5676_scaffold1737G00990 [Cucumis melo var. makuwa]